MPVMVTYKVDGEFHREIKLEDNNDLVVTCRRITEHKVGDLMVLMHNCTARDINHLIYALEQMKPFVPQK